MKRLPVWALYTLSLALAAPSLAANVPEKRAESARETPRGQTLQQESRAQEERMRVRRVSQILGASVYNRESEMLGDIEELVLDPDRGQIAYAVLSAGGFLGIGDKWFAIPWKALQLNSDKDHYVLNVDKEVLKAAPGFNKDDWPDMANERWREDIHSHYRQKPYWQEQASVTPEKSADSAISDAVITTKIKAALLADPAIKSLGISVDASQGVVRLSGSVATPAQARRAEQTARAIEGVKSVKNEINLTQ